MSMLILLFFCSILRTTWAAAVPASSGLVPSSTSTSGASEPTVPYASDDPNEVLWSPESETSNPQPIRGSFGASVLSEENISIDRQNPDFLASPSTDSGSIPNAKWPFSMSHNRLLSGGWVRQQNVDVMPIATEMASANMRLLPGALRENHWHLNAEWSYVLEGCVQITAINTDGQNYLSTVCQGDLWYFPAGIPHSLQATGDNPGGAEFLLVFDDGTFSATHTFSLTDWLAHTPKEVIAKNFGVPSSAFDSLPDRELYMLPGTVPSKDAVAPSDPQGVVADPLSFALSQVEPTKLPGGTVKIVDSRTFKASVTIAAADITVEPGAMREMHYHPTQDDFFISGYARVTLFGAAADAATFDYQAGDVGYVPAGYGHYVENIGNTTLHFLEIFKTDVYQDISLNQWLALVPPQVVKDNLGISDETIAAFKKEKQIVVAPYN